MTDMRVIWVICMAILLGFGLLIAKAFLFSISWVLWPIGVVGLVSIVLIFIIGSMPT